MTANIVTFAAHHRDAPVGVWPAGLA